LLPLQRGFGGWALEALEQELMQAQNIAVPGSSRRWRSTPLRRHWLSFPGPATILHWTRDGGSSLLCLSRSSRHPRKPRLGGQAQGSKSFRLDYLSLPRASGWIHRCLQISPDCRDFLRSLCNLFHQDRIWWLLLGQHRGLTTGLPPRENLCLRHSHDTGLSLDL
jgi:hypothetical protein